MAVWVVRAGDRGAEELVALENDLVTIHWNELSDLSGVKSRDELRALYVKARPGEAESPGKVGAGVGQVWAFLREIKKGDLALIPLMTRRSSVAVGEVIGPYAYRIDLGDDVHHTIPVKWISPDLLRTRLSPDLAGRLGLPRTVYQIKVEKADERIRSILRGDPDGPNDAGRDDADAAEQPDPEESSRDELLRFIERKFTRHKLAELVDAVLQAEGYMTRLSPQGPDGGVDILAGSGPMGFAEPRLCVQVKSSASPVDVTVLRGLQGIFNTFGADQGLLVSWGGFTSAARKEAAQHFFSLRLWEAGDVLEAIFKNYDKFPEDWKAELPLKRIWALVSEE